MGASGDGASMSAKRGDPAPARPASSRAASPAPTAGSGLPILVPTNQQVKTMDCEGRAVSVQGNGNRLTLKGLCGPVTVGGNENILEVGSTTRIDTSGNRNVVKYRELVNDKAPGRHLRRHRQPRLEGRTAVEQRLIGGLASPAGPHRGPTRAKLARLCARSSVG